jgi:hypothetical protein
MRTAMPKGRVESFSDCVVDPRLLWLNSLYLMWIAFLPFPTGLLGNHTEQPVAVAVYRSVCAETCGFRYALLFFTSQASPPGCSSRPSACSYTVLFRRLTPSADLRVSSARSTRDDRQAWRKNIGYPWPPNFIADPRRLPELQVL